ATSTGRARRGSPPRSAGRRPGRSADLWRRSRLALFFQNALTKRRAQFAAADLAHGGHGEVVDEDDLVRHLEVGDVALAHPRLQLDAARRGAVGDDEGADALA